jgi:Uma2 family endonuclease
MSAVLKPPKRLTFSEFLTLTQSAMDWERWELLGGQAILMAPQSERHQRIVGSLSDHLRRIARQHGCVGLPGLGVVSDGNEEYAPIPDFVVRCGPPLDGSYAKDVVLLAEVLSPSTMSNDRGRKPDFYRTLPNLRTILVVFQDEVRVEALQRDDAGEWQWVVRKRREDSLALPELGGELRLADVYEDVPLD